MDLQEQLNREYSRSYLNEAFALGDEKKTEETPSADDTFMEDMSEIEKNMVEEENVEMGNRREMRNQIAGQIETSLKTLHGLQDTLDTLSEDELENISYVTTRICTAAADLDAVLITPTENLPAQFD